MLSWHAGEPDLHAAIEAAIARALAADRPLVANRRRTLYRLEPRALPAMVLKIHHHDHRRRGLRALQRELARGLRRDPARREWRALERAYALELAIPRPRGWGRLGTADSFVVCDAVAGESLDVFLARQERELSPRDWEDLCRSLSREVRRFHAAGLAHGDLHAGNLRYVDGRVVLLDLQRTRTLDRERQRLADLARLEYSLERAGVSISRCQALRRAFGVGRELDAARLRFERDHLRGRARKRLAKGRAWRAVRDVAGPGTRGLRDRALDPATLRQLLASPARFDRARPRRGARVRVVASTIEGRRFVLKRIDTASTTRAVGDAIRGSAAARAFRRGQSLALVSDRVARPLAYLERRRLGLFPVRSWLVLEHVGECDLDAFEPADESDATHVAERLAAWLADGHAHGLGHRDLKGGNIRLTHRDGEIRFWLIDLEDLLPLAAIAESQRIEALSQLNASLADERFGLPARRAALARYRDRLPFERPPAEIEREIAQRSLARRHRWQGTGCRAVSPRAPSAS